MKVATWNINSIKVRLPAVIQYLEETSPDVLALQETKCTNDNFPSNEIEKLGYTCIFSGQKTYNGVALILKEKPTEIELDPITTLENEKRSISATYTGIKILNLYVVNGQDIGSTKYEYKLRWLDVLLEYLFDTIKKHNKIIVLGDFNIAPTDDDVFDIEMTKNQILCSSKERSYLNKLAKLGLTDLFLNFQHPTKTFSWWDYRAGSFHRNIGYRIDLILGTRLVSQSCGEVYIDKYI